MTHLRERAAWTRWTCLSVALYVLLYLACESPPAAKVGALAAAWVFLLYYRMVT